MGKHIAGRLLLLIFLLFATSTVTFFIVHLLPGDPAAAILGEGAGEEEIRQLRRRLNLDRSLPEQYLAYNRNLLNLSFGVSLWDGKKVFPRILRYFPNTFFLALASMVLALLISFPLGVWAAFRERGTIDVLVTFGSSVGLAVPNFLLGPLLIVFFSVKLGILPVSGSGGFRYLVLPALTLGLSMSAFLTRVVRVAVVGELGKPYVLLARAKGLRRGRIFFRHIFKNMMFPVMATVGIQFGMLLTGVVITENVFSRQGVGVLLVEAVGRRDFPVMQGVVVFMTAVYLVVHFVVDLLYMLLDPRLRYDVKAGK